MDAHDGAGNNVRSQRGGWMSFFSMGGANQERVTVTVLRHDRAGVAARHAENSWSNTHEGWLAAEVAVGAGSFSAQFPAAFRAEDFIRFQQALQPLQDTLMGEATFSTEGQQLFLRVVGNDRGHIEVIGIALAWPGEGEKCEFRLALDQAGLARTLRELAQLLATFPADGSTRTLGR